MDHRSLALTIDGLLDDGPMTLNAALDSVCQIARALEGIHARGEVHPHLHPGNILALSSREFALVDLGPAEGLGYLSPEQLRCGDVTPAANQYQLGVLLHHLIAGRPPHDGLGLDQVKVCRLSGPPVSIAKAADFVPAAVDEIGRTLMASAPDQRYPSMLAARMALEAALEAFRKGLRERVEPAPARRPARPVLRSATIVRESQAMLTVAMAILVVAASVLVIGVHLG